MSRQNFLYSNILNTNQNTVLLLADGDEYNFTNAEVMSYQYRNSHYKENTVSAAMLSIM